MSNFTLNISNTLNNVSTSKTKLKNYKDSLNTYLNSVLNVDSVWNDSNTDAFVSTIRKEKYDFNDHINSLSNYLKIIEDFCNSVQKIILSNFSVSPLKKVGYNLGNINKTIELLNLCYNELNNNYEIFRSMQIPADFKYNYLLNQYRSDTYELKNKVINTRYSLEDVKKRIEVLINNTKQKINSHEVVNISNTICEHRYKVSNVINLNGITDNTQYNATVSTKIDKSNMESVNYTVNLENLGSLNQSKQGEINGVNYTVNLGNLGSLNQIEQKELNGVNYAVNLNNSVKENQIINQELNYRTPEIKVSIPNVEETNIKTNFINPKSEVTFGDLNVSSNNVQSTQFTTSVIPDVNKVDVANNIQSTNMINKQSQQIKQTSLDTKIVESNLYNNI